LKTAEARRTWRSILCEPAVSAVSF
jgi:hypothetical protein